ncbi:TPA: hypothetical protein ACJZ6E_001793, partial [Streptococcus pneumoniae]
RSEYQKRKDKICPFSSLAFFQPTTVDKEPKSFVPFLPSKYKNSPSDKIRGARNVVKSTAELLNFMVRDKIVH